MSESAQRTCARFNERHHVGAKVRYWTGPRGGSETVKYAMTRTHAQVIASGIAVVWVAGHAGCIALTHVEAL